MKRPFSLLGVIFISADSLSIRCRWLNKNIVAVRLARALGAPARVEIALKAKGATLRLLSDGQEVLTAQVPTEFAVLYLPKGKYEAEIPANGQTRREMLMCESK